MMDDAEHDVLTSCLFPGNTTQRARDRALETIAPMGDDPVISLPAAAS